MKLKLALLAAAGSLTLASAASAQDQGWYGSLGAGYTFANDENDFEDQGGATPASFVTDYDLDETMNIYGAFGRYLNSGFRGELEFATRTQNVDELPGDGFAFQGFPGPGNLGDYTVNTLMVNIYKDFDMGGVFTPYIGGGLGAAFMNVEANNTSTVQQAATAGNQPYLIYMGDRDTRAAAQAMAGVAYDLTENIDLDVRYRYLLTDKFEYGAAINGPVTAVEGQFEANEVTFGLRWNFGAPAPVVEEPVAPPVTYKDCWDGSRVVSTASCPPEPVIEEEVAAPEELDLTVYFDFDKSNLTSAAQSLISARTEEALQYDIESVVVQGNTDTSGSASYNNALSARRAGVVSDALVANGIDGSLITTQALGESNPAKPTADGVREPLNRRTEVTFNF